MAVEGGGELETYEVLVVVSDKILYLIMFIPEH